MNFLLACAACFGQSDSPMARGMNWGIFSLLAVVVTVLGSIAAFSIFLARRAAAVSSLSPALPAANAGDAPVSFPGQAHSNPAP